LQGVGASRRGFVRTGDTVEIVSKQSVFHALRATGAAFFTLAFPDPDQPLARRLERPGVVELSSGAEYYWMRAYLFVDDHPYYARTDEAGRFELKDVPAGRHRMICWFPDWRLEHHERNPETGQVMRWKFRPPIEVVEEVAVRAGQASEAAYVLSLDLASGD
jgi:hypothetical protein